MITVRGGVATEIAIGQGQFIACAAHGVIAPDTHMKSLHGFTLADLKTRTQPGKGGCWHIGSEAERYFNLARGIDERPVQADGEAKSIGHEQTFEVNVADPAEVRRVLLDQVEQVASRLRRHGVQAKGVSLKIRFGNFQTINRSLTLDEPTDVTEELWQAARGLFDKWQFQPVRLIGITAERLVEDEAPQGLFPDPERDQQKKLDTVADQINARFGTRAIRRGGAV